MKGKVFITVPCADVEHAIQVRDRINGLIVHIGEPQAYIGQSGVVIPTSEPARVGKDLEEEGFV